MKRILLFIVTVLTAGSVSAQGQMGNSDMETWETVAGSDQEPTNWNSFLTGQGPFVGFAANQIEKSTDVRPGSTGTYSARIWSRNAGFGIIANGNMTVGRINMGSTTANNPANHNISLTADPLFSETLTDMPDSIVFWAKYSAASGSSMARMKASLHDNYDFKDPSQTADSAHIVGDAKINFQPTNGWVRIAVAFDYTGPATGNTHILVTFTSNATPGGGAADDDVYIDDIELIYNPGGPTDTDGDGVTDADELVDGTDDEDLCDFILASQSVAPSSTWNSTDCDFDGVSNGQELINQTDPLVMLSENGLNSINVSMDNASNTINVISQEALNGTYAIYNTLGQQIQLGELKSSIPFNQPSGMYFVHLITNTATYKYEIYKK